jgi:hypothetical protein
VTPGGQGRDDPGGDDYQQDEVDAQSLFKYHYINLEYLFAGKIRPFF